MFAVRDRERPDTGALTDFFWTLPEAETHVAGCRRITVAGEHPGHTYLEIIEVDRDSRPCVYCGHEVQSQNPDTDFCRGCHYAGVEKEASRDRQIEFFHEHLPGVTVDVEHTGGGCFWMAFSWEDEPVFYVATDGEASLPEIDGEPIRDGWGYVGRHSDDEESPDCDGTPILEPVATEGNLYWDEYPQHSLTDWQVVDAILTDRRQRET